MWADTWAVCVDKCSAWVSLWRGGAPREIVRRKLSRLTSVSQVVFALWMERERERDTERDREGQREREGARSKEKARRDRRDRREGEKEKTEGKGDKEENRKEKKRKKRKINNPQSQGSAVVRLRLRPVTEFQPSPLHQLCFQGAFHHFWLNRDVKPLDFGTSSRCGSHIGFHQIIFSRNVILQRPIV